MRRRCERGRARRRRGRALPPVPFRVRGRPGGPLTPRDRHLCGKALLARALGPFARAAPPRAQDESGKTPPGEPDFSRHLQELGSRAFRRIDRGAGVLARWRDRRSVRPARHRRRRLGAVVRLRHGRRDLQRGRGQRRGRTYRERHRRPGFDLGRMRGDARPRATRGLHPCGPRAPRELGRASCRAGRRRSSGAERTPLCCGHRSRAGRVRSLSPRPARVLSRSVTGDRVSLGICRFDGTRPSGQSGDPCRQGEEGERRRERAAPELRHSALARARSRAQQGPGLGPRLAYGERHRNGRVPPGRLGPVRRQGQGGLCPSSRCRAAHRRGGAPSRARRGALRHRVCPRRARRGRGRPGDVRGGTRGCSRAVE